MTKRPFNGCNRSGLPGVRRLDSEPIRCCNLTMTRMCQPRRVIGRMASLTRDYHVKCQICQNHVRIPDHFPPASAYACVNQCWNVNTRMRRIQNAEFAEKSPWDYLSYSCALSFDFR